MHIKLLILIMFQIPPDYSPAVLLRNITQSIIQPYATPQKTYQSDELRKLLLGVFKYRQYEVSYELMKVLCFGKHKYISITLQQLIDYIMEKYIGQTTINNFNYQKGYARKEEKVMTRSEFIETLSLGVTHFEQFSIEPYQEVFQAIFDQLDKNRSGTISQDLYYEFLKYYFGSESPMAINPTKRVTEIAQSQQLISSSEGEHPPERMSPQTSSKNMTPNSLHHIKQMNQQISQHKSALDQFRELITNQIRIKCVKFDHDRDGYLNRRDSESFLYEVIELEEKSIDFIINSYFNFNMKTLIDYASVIEIVAEVHFRQIVSNIMKSDHHVDSTIICLFKSYFIEKIIQNCYFFTEKPSEELIGRVYDQLLAKRGNSKQEMITLEMFREYILVEICNNRPIFRQQPSKKSTGTFNIPPESIMEVENSNYEEDEQSSDQVRSRKGSSFRSISKSNRNSQAEITVSNNKISKINKQSQKSIKVVNQLLVPEQTVPLSAQYIKGISVKLFQNQPDLKQTQQLDISPSKLQLGQKISLKEMLWRELENIALKYSLSVKGKLNKEQCQKYLGSETMFYKDLTALQNRIGKLYLKSSYVDIEVLTSLIIHFKGEEGLVQFSKRQIKGKSSLSQVEITQILKQAYGQCLNTSTIIFSQFTQLLFKQNLKNMFLYRNYLELIARNLSIKSTF